MTLHEILPTVTKPARYIGNELHSFQKKNPLLKVALVYPDVYERGMSNYTLRLLYHLFNREEGVHCERFFAPWKDMKERLVREGLPFFSLESHTPLNSFPLILILLNNPLSYPTILHLLDMAKISYRSLQRKEGDPVILGGGLPCNNPEPLALYFDGFWIGDEEEIIPEILKTIREFSIQYSPFSIPKEEILFALSEIEGVYIPRFPKIVQPRFLSTLRKEDSPTMPIVPFIEVDRDYLLLEVERHKALRPLEDVVELVEEGISKTGWEELALLSSSSPSSLPEILRSLSNFLQENQIILRLPSLNPSDFSNEGFRALKDVRKGPLRLRGNGGCEEELIQSVERAREEGFQKIKLQFDLGSKGMERMEEWILGVFNLSQEARKAAGRSIQVTISPSLPTPHRDGERNPLSDIEVFYQSEKYLKSLSRRMANNFLIRMTSGEMAHLQGLLFRGDQSYSKVIEGVYRKGGFLESWNEHFSYERWIRSFQEVGLDPREEARRWENSDRLPWDFIHPPPCETSSNPLEAEGTPNFKQGSNPCFKQGQLPISRSPNSWGRQKRRISTSSPFSRLRIRVCFSKGDEVRFLSHLNLIRLIHRALRRARIPVAYSKGFSPRPKVAFGPPLSLGMTGQYEYFDLILSESVSSGKFLPTELVVSMNQVLPKGFFIREAKPLSLQSTSLTEILNIGVYQVEGLTFKTRPNPFDSYPPELLELKEGVGGLEMVMRMGEGVNRGPKKILENYFGFSLEEIQQCKIERKGLYIQEGDQRKRP